jgi:heat shock protein HslJ
MRKTWFFVLIQLIMTGMLMAACSLDRTSSDLAGNSWKLVSYGPVAEPVLAVEGIETSLKFDTGGQVSGNFGCNGFSGEYSQKDDQLTFGALMSTMMACPEPQMSQEATSFQVLTGTVNFVVDGNTLTITNEVLGTVLIFSRR